jgi:ubiquinol-cytochrome c reductase iron-sulfur subunit
MDEDNPDLNRRRALTASVAAVGGVAVGAGAMVFAQSLQPSDRAKNLGAPINIDLGDLQPGEMKIEEWRGMPVWVLRRTPEMLETMKSQEGMLKDPVSETESQQPEYARNQFRSITPEYLVLLGVCSHLGCSPALKPKPDFSHAPDWWNGGFFCACHYSKFDYAGRVFLGDSPAPSNLPVPPHYYVSDTVIRVGEEET